jgi:hypothetical protein
LFGIDFYNNVLNKILKKQHLNVIIIENNLFIGGTKMNDNDIQPYNYEYAYNEIKQELERSENAYKSAIQEVNRLRGVAREYSGFYNKIKEAFEKQDWDAVKAAITWADE